MIDLAPATVTGGRRVISLKKAPDVFFNSFFTKFFVVLAL